MPIPTAESGPRPDTTVQPPCCLTAATVPAAPEHVDLEVLHDTLAVSAGLPELAFRSERRLAYRATAYRATLLDRPAPLGDPTARLGKMTESQLTADEDDRESFPVNARWEADPPVDIRATRKRHPLRATGAQPIHAPLLRSKVWPVKPAASAESR